MATLESDTKRSIRVAIIGAGLSGLTLANGLLRDTLQRYDVQVYERDTVAFTSERGGYQIRIGAPGLEALKRCSDDELWASLSTTWAGDEAEAPALVDPNFGLQLRLADLKLYPSSRPVPRHALRAALLGPLLAQDRVHFSHEFDNFELISEDGPTGVKVHFNGQQSVLADILIAADGSRSKVNRQVGLNNKVKLDGWHLFQSRQIINKDVRSRLPKSLLDCGSVLFLGGLKASGFASVYDTKVDTTGSENDTSTLFWACLVPGERGKEWLKRSHNDPQRALTYLIEYLREELGYGESLPFIMKSATEHLREGLVTSSVKPLKDWRNGEARHARIILLGDAVHPMTPGRGMGANQALQDASQLIKRFHEIQWADALPSDEELSSLVSNFDREMYDRAFKMVKASEDVTSLDLSKTSGKILIRAVGVLLMVLGWGASVLEMVGLRKAQRLDFSSHAL
ncbi:hypothetical protein AC579_9217 [Pseudocercospora musae]|uniref:FAD-binding domain-containing protein n=1 Tax=Pseudocercospora musae TaxID=113226 RepID=A0A139I1E3_9PEZI|nr:hypothetical protein AC579_9217 [Pseudocercospora musae]